jgi:hypothetical protein
MGRECCSSRHAAVAPAPRAGASGQGRGARALARAGGGANGGGGEELPLAALVVAPLASIMAGAGGAVQGAVQAVLGAGDALTLLVGTAAPLLLRRLDSQQQANSNDSDADATTATAKRARGLPTLSARDITTFRALARAGGEVGGGLLSLGGLAAVAAVSRMSPCGPGCCDSTPLERAANVLTSAPYVVVGLRAARRRRTPEGRAWGLSMAAVGAASTFFHAAPRGPAKELGRKLDYWAIAASSALLCRALRPGGGVPRRLTAASLAATPFRPFPVSTLNTLAMELEFLRRAAAHGGPGGRSEGLRGQQMLHSACALGAMVFFSLEGALPHVPLLHSSWHLLSSVSCATTNALLEDVERGMGLAVDHRAAAGGGGGDGDAKAPALAPRAAAAAAAAGRPSLEMYVVPLEA